MSRRARFGAERSPAEKQADLFLIDGLPAPSKNVMEEY